MQFNDNVLLVAQGGGVMSPEILTGVYKALQETGTIPGKVLASSGGALFSGLYYSDKDSKWFTDLMQNKDLSQWIQLCPVQTVKSLYSKSNYIVDNTGLKNFLYQQMNAHATQRVEVSVTCLNDYTAHMKLATPSWVLAATSIPFLFMPVKNGEHLWGDGGVLNNIPVPSVEQCKKYQKVIIVCTPPSQFTGKTQGIGGLLEMLAAVMDRQVQQLKESGYLEQENVVLIQPQSSHGGNLLKWSDNFGLREESYNITKELIEKGAIYA